MKVRIPVTVMDCVGMTALIHLFIGIQTDTHMQ